MRRLASWSSEMGLCDFGDVRPNLDGDVVEWRGELAAGLCIWFRGRCWYRLVWRFVTGGFSILQVFHGSRCCMLRLEVLIGLAVSRR